MERGAQKHPARVHSRQWIVADAGVTLTLLVTTDMLSPPSILRKLMNEASQQYKADTDCKDAVEQEVLPARSIQRRSMHVLYVDPA
jgi:hypothetical protein